jgi:DNA mismatch endonuclease (patch repair protein)
MTDIVDKQTRSRMMAGIKGKDTQPEMKVRRFLHASGFRYRLHVRALHGKPDICLPKYHAVIFVQGCFWHRHKGCHLSYMPASNKDSWQTKFKQNVRRDRKNVRALIKEGWRVIILWECGLRKSGNYLLDWLPSEIEYGNEQYVEWPSEAKAK